VDLQPSHRSLLNLDDVLWPSSLENLEGPQWQRQYRFRRSADAILGLRGMYLRWRSLVQPWESCITRPGNFHVGDDDISKLPPEMSDAWNTPDQNCFCLARAWMVFACSRIDVGRPSGKPSTGATTPRLGSCAQSFVSHARHARDAVHSYIPLRIKWRNMGQGPRVVGLEGSATSLLRVWHGLLAIVDLCIRNSCPT